MNLIIVTCPQLVNDRLPKQITSLNLAISAGLITGVKILCMKDSDAMFRTKSVYQPDQWTPDIVFGWNIFKANISNAISDDRPNTNIASDFHEASKVFPPRLLTTSEQSVAMRHILAIEAIAKSDIPCIVLEDDALISDQTLFHELLDYLRHNCKNNLFYDLADDYIPINTNEHRSLFVGNLHFCEMPIALTRTLMAYAMSPEIALLLSESLSYYALPIDMQLQISLSRLLLPGLSLANSPIVHGSKKNFVLSSVHQA